jgi:hypothetical protein
VDVDDGVLAPRVIEDALGRGRLAGVDVGDDSDIADIGKGCSTGHGGFRAGWGVTGNSKAERWALGFVAAYFDMLAAGLQSFVLTKA